MYVCMCVCVCVFVCIIYIYIYICMNACVYVLAQVATGHITEVLSRGAFSVSYEEASKS